MWTQRTGTRRHRLGPGLEQTAGGEECHRVFAGPQRKVGLWVTVMKGTLRIDEAGQEVPVEVFRFGNDANLSVPGSHLQGELVPVTTGTLAVRELDDLVWVPVPKSSRKWSITLAMSFAPPRAARNPSSMRAFSIEEKTGGKECLEIVKLLVKLPRLDSNQQPFG
jgi:hypothetical protein